MKIETEFRDFMKKAYPHVEIKSNQYEISRLIFYSGAASSRHFQQKDYAEIYELLFVSSEDATTEKSAERILKEWTSKI